MRQIIVIGGGIGGLATAYRRRAIAEARSEEVEIRLLEAGQRWGGVIRSTTEEGHVLEHGPDSILRTKPAGIQLISDLGLSGEMQETCAGARRSLIARKVRLLPVPEGLYLMAPGRLLPFLRSPIVSWPGKLRMALDLVLPRRDPLASEESLAEFVRRRLGQEALDRIAQPLISGIYTADPEQLSMVSTMPLFLRMEREHRSLILAMRLRSQEAGMAQASGPRYGLFTSLRGGLQTLTDALVAKLSTASASGRSRVDMRLGASVTAVVRNAGRMTVALEEEYLDADEVVIAAPAHAAGKMVKTLDPLLSYLLVTIPYAGVLTINLAFQRQQIPQLPEAAGFVVPAIEGRTLIACTLASLKYPERAPADSVLLRAFVGGALHQQHCELSDGEVLAAVMRDLRDLLGIQGEPTMVRIHRWPKAMAQYVLGHAERLQGIRLREKTIPGLALVGNGYEGVGIPDIIAQADQAAERLGSSDQGMPPPMQGAISRATTV
jgi:oxygen-dependent protoporphyrinogen oxidase